MERKQHGGGFDAAEGSWARVSVLCVGNEYQLDDGFGPAVASYLRERYRFREGVEVLDRAVMGYGIVPDLMACDGVVVVDALDGTGADPGTVFSFEPSDMACGAGMVSLHEVRFSDVLAAATFMGAACEARCFGAQVLDRGDGTMERGLSPRVEAAVSLVSRAVVRHLDDAWHAGSRDLWRESGDPRALLEDARAYVSAALAACGVADEPATGMLDGVSSTMADYEADDLVSKLLEGV